MHVYDDQIVHSMVPVGETVEVTGFSADNWAQIEAMTPEHRLEMFSSKSSPFNSKETASSD